MITLTEIQIQKCKAMAVEAVFISWNTDNYTANQVYDVLVANDQFETYKLDLKVRVWYVGHSTDTISALVVARMLAFREAMMFALNEC